MRDPGYKGGYDSLADVKTRLEKLGPLSDLNRMANVPKFLTPADPAYVQGDQQALIDRFNQLLAELQRQGIMAPEK